MPNYRDSANVFISFLIADKVLILAVIVVSILTVGNVFNKILLDFEPLQYSVFSYDKILHYLTSLILVRIIFWMYRTIRSDLEPRKVCYVSSILTLLLYAVMWEIFEMFTFIIQINLHDQLLLEIMDIPLDWIYDILGVVTSNFLGYSVKQGVA